MLPLTTSSSLHHHHLRARPHPRVCVQLRPRPVLPPFASCPPPRGLGLGLMVCETALKPTRYPPPLLNPLPPYRDVDTSAAPRGCMTSSVRSWIFLAGVCI